MSYAEIEILKYWKDFMSHRELLKKTYEVAPNVLNSEKLNDFHKLVRFSESIKTRYEEIKFTSDLINEIDKEYQQYIMGGVLLYPYSSYREQTLEEYIQEIKDTNINVYDANKRMLSDFNTRTRYECMMGCCKKRARYEFGICHDCQAVEDLI
jgi:hypothetical protein